MSVSTKIVISILVLAVGLAGVYAFMAKTQEQVAVRVGYRTHDLYLPLFVGVEKGFFAEENLKIEQVKFESTNQLTDSLIADQLDAALGGINTFILYTIQEKSPNELKIFSMVNETEDAPSGYLLIKTGSDIKSIEELKGKKIGAFQGSTARLIYKKVIGRYFDPAEATLVQMNPDLSIAALESGQVDAVIVLEPLKTIAEVKAIARPLEAALYSRYILEGLPLAASVVSAAFAENNPEVLKRFIRASNKAFDFINQNPEEAKRILTKFTPLEEDMANRINLPYYQKLEEISPDKLQDLADVLAEEGELGGHIDASRMVLEQ